MMLVVNVGVDIVKVFVIRVFFIMFFMYFFLSLKK